MNINSIDLNRPQRFTQDYEKNKLSQKPAPQFGNTNGEATRNVKVVAATSSLLGTSIVLALLAKKQGFYLNPKTIKNTPIKDWAIFKIAKKNEPDRKLLEIEEGEIISLATGSIAGGLAGGAIFDKKNIKAKGREALTQLAGNVLVPVGFVSGASKLYSKFEDSIVAVLPQLSGEGKVVKFTNKFIKALPAMGITLLALGAGICTGSKVTNFINEKLFGQKQKREIKTSDFAPHVDDLCLGITLMGAKDSPVVSSITRTVPLFLAIPEYQVGKAQEKV